MVTLFGKHLQKGWGSNQFELKRGPEEMLLGRWVLPVEIFFQKIVDVTLIAIGASSVLILRRRF
jgi:hypothetical protein